MTIEHTPAGATPVVAGATPAQTLPAAPVAVTTPAPPPATGDADALGDAGKKALDAMKSERNAAVTAQKKAETELETLRLASASDSDKAIAAARKEGADEITEKANARVRRSEVRAALATAGINASVLDLATKADEFAALKVTDDGDVDGLDEAIKDFKKSKPDLFKAPVMAATAGGGVPAGDKDAPKDLTTALEELYSPQR